MTHHIKHSEVFVGVSKHDADKPIESAILDALCKFDSYAKERGDNIHATGFVVNRIRGKLNELVDTTTKEQSTYTSVQRTEVEVEVFFEVII